MGRRGITYHARGALPDEAFAAIGVPVAVLGRNRSWTSFAPLGDIDALALDVPVVQITADDDHGTSLTFSTPDGWSAELSLAETPGKQDRALVAQLVARGVLTKARAAKLLGPSDGVEERLGVPYTETLPAPLTARLVPDGATIVKPTRRPRRTRAAPPPASTMTVDPAVLRAHVVYWVNVFQGNCFKLYNRYKKHLPAERRREVDALCDAVFTTRELPDIAARVTAILGSIWTADDWVAALRVPELLEFDDQRAEWERTLATLGPAR